MRRLLCYAEGRDAACEAFCPALTSGVQGRSFEEVYRSLNAAIRDYVEAAQKEDRATAGRLLNRKAPFLERLRFYRRFWGAILKSHKDEETHGFTILCPA